MATSISAEQHIARAERHRIVGAALVNAADEWSAVCYFYSAYHLVGYALRSDPIFDDPVALRLVHADLTQRDRNTTRHRGRKPRGGDARREFGVNELVTLLYPGAGVQYERLHQASIDVRYLNGLHGKPLARLGADLDAIWELYDSGKLRYGI